MAKVRQISELEEELPLYQESELLTLYRSGFQASESGQSHKLFPFTAIAETFRLQDKPTGRKAYFNKEGRIALMLLKNYTGSSGKKLIEQINGSIYFQLFCGIFIRPGEEIKDTKLVSEIRTELSQTLDLNRFQEVLAQNWKPHLNNTGIVMSDATCYESHLRFPTNEKLLWESIQWIYDQIITICKQLKIRRPRSKYDEIQKRYLSFSRKRKKTQKQKRKLRTSLIYLLGKLESQLTTIERQHRSVLKLDTLYHKRHAVIKTILVQQRQMHESKVSIPERIVSIDKHYIRPIVRGKETKAVEFGAKANLIQIDGINFIEHIGFKAFNEGARGISSIGYAQKLFRKRVTHFAGDAIYATNKTRKYCSSRRSPIYTSFAPKGRRGSDEAEKRVLRSLLSKERSTRLEGSFGTEKEHHCLRKVKARTKENELLWIVFGTHTANAVRLALRVMNMSKEAA